jgi:hypothetical protein
MVLGGPGYNQSVRLLTVMPLITLCLMLAMFAVPAVQDAADAEGEMLISADVVLAYEPSFNPSDTQELLDEILRRAEYQGEDDAPLEQDNMLARLLAWLDGVLSAAGLGATGWAGVVVVAGLLALLLYLVVKLIWVQAGRHSRSAKAEPKAGQLGLDELLLAAGESAQRGDFRAAIRFRFLALLRQLEVPASTLLTNTQLKRKLGKRMPSAETPFREFVGIYEDTWYGGFDCSNEQHALALALSEQVADVATRDTYE